MARTTIDFGIDLGTSNSSIAVMDNSEVRVIRNADGMDVTPSVVRVLADGTVAVGRRARQMLEVDPDNTRAEFKRLMGTTEEWTFPKSKRTFGPESLSAEVLKSLRADARDQLGEEVKAAVVTVPALFEIPQCEATVRAAKLAGLDEVHLLQEPIASAIACGYRDPSNVRGHWLVYDLGGGTFDTSLLSVRDGRMQVLDHDGDNFLGGKDFDRLVADRVVALLREREPGLVLDRATADPAMRRAWAKLKAAAEEAKIALSRAARARVTVEELMPGLECDVELTREEYDALIAPWVTRTLDIVGRLLERNRLSPTALERLIFVGGPTLTPSLRGAVEQTLGLVGVAGVDPMTVVAQGAALHAATRTWRPASAAAPAGGRRVRLEYPPISQDSEPYVVGRIVADEGDGALPAEVEIASADGTFRSGRVPLNERGGFAVSVRLHRRGATRFELKAFDARGDAVPVDPDAFSITWGMVVADPPLSRSLGVATADDRMQVYLEKGTSLPARRTFTHKTVVPVKKGEHDALLRVPVVQGGSLRASRNRLVGTLEVDATTLRRDLPVGSEVEVTLEMDASGTVRAHAFVPLVDQVFDRVITLQVPRPELELLGKLLWEERGRLSKLRRSAAQHAVREAMQLTQSADGELGEIERELEAARGGDQDAAQQALRRLIELQVTLDSAEAALRWPSAEEELEQAHRRARIAVIEDGQPLEREHFAALERDVKDARERKDLPAIERLDDELHRLAWAIERRDPAAWIGRFEYLRSLPHPWTDGPKAHGLLDRGRDAVQRGDHPVVQSTVEELWRLLPPDAERRAKGFDSGIR